MAIKSLDADPSKQEEIEFFKAISALVPEKAYLHNFFTQDLINWVEGKVLDDWNLDLLGVVGEQQSAIWKLEAEVSKANQTISLERMQGTETIDKMGGEITRLTEMLNKELADKRDLNRQLLEVHQNYADYKAKAEQEIERLKLVIADMYLASRQ